MTNVFYAILANSLTALLTNTFVWFAATFWVYLQTESVLAMSVMAGIYLITVSISGFFLGALVDRYRKKTVMMLSSLCSLILYTLAYGILALSDPAVFTDPGSPRLWGFILLVLTGAIAGNLRSIALSTLVTLLIPEDKRDQANGLVGTSDGISFLVASTLSGLVIGFLGVQWMLGIAIAFTLLAMIHLVTLSIPEGEIIPTESETNQIDIRGTIRAIRLVPGLFALIFFNTFNNLLGGVFMSLMDAYGLSLVSVQTWGILWGGLSLGFILGGIIVARRGLGKNPLRTLFLANAGMWLVAMFFTIQASIVLLTIGAFIFLCLDPVVEAAEHTILQTVIPYERQGRVFGFAQSIEQSASPLTAFMIGPIAQFVFIPFMTTGAGVELLGPWFGTGRDRGIALVFTVTGLVGLILTVLAMRSHSYRTLSKQYRKAKTHSLEAKV
ncbi:MFS transporter [Acaryochloris sp. 'Moss Beach']|uniref:MFS transporter n=1 Tax=Acaryochloris sp. 'Moss Beach' TaxID=2740837 RepID=UPI001F28AD0C|nr:MFS transporter [Acaryochloris sp. 'Moss Beach']UJB69403.1 MFS transporter [Acaryochloris sp. 'Moss Beach']